MVKKKTLRVANGPPLHLVSSLTTVDWLGSLVRCSFHIDGLPESTEKNVVSLIATRKFLDFLPTNLGSCVRVSSGKERIEQVSAKKFLWTPTALLFPPILAPFQLKANSLVCSTTTYKVVITHYSWLLCRLTYRHESSLKQFTLALPNSL